MKNCLGWTRRMLVILLYAVDYYLSIFSRNIYFTFLFPEYNLHIQVNNSLPESRPMKLFSKKDMHFSSTLLIRSETPHWIYFFKTPVLWASEVQKTWSPQNYSEAIDALFFVHRSVWEHTINVRDFWQVVGFALNVYSLWSKQFAVWTMNILVSVSQNRFPHDRADIL